MTSERLEALPREICGELLAQAIVFFAAANQRRRFLARELGERGALAVGVAIWSERVVDDIVVDAGGAELAANAHRSHSFADSSAHEGVGETGVIEPFGVETRDRRGDRLVIELLPLQFATELRRGVPAMLKNAQRGRVAALQLFVLRHQRSCVQLVTT